MAFYFFVHITNSQKIFINLHNNKMSINQQVILLLLITKFYFNEQKMMRMSSLSNVKKSAKKNQDHRTTKTKASAKKPQIFPLSLARNKHNPHPSLFNSIKKQRNDPKVSKYDHSNCKYQKRKIANSQNELDLFESLHTKISFDYINSLYSDIALQFGFKLRDKLSNKQNELSEKNLNLSVRLPVKQEKQCLDKISNLIMLKKQINCAYQSMKNTQFILTHVIEKNSTQNANQDSYKELNTFPLIHQSVSNFLSNFKSIQKELQHLQHKFDERVRKQQQMQARQQEVQNQDEAQMDYEIQQLKEQIAEEKNLCLRYQREEKFLISKLYFTQKKNHDLKASSSNLQIKNTNLRDTIRFSIPKSLQKPKEQQKTLQRSLSAKLQRIKRYNFQNDQINTTNLKTQRQMVKSRSTSSLNSAHLNSIYQPNRQKETFFDKIY